ncbi:MAG: hypothetical protein K0S61_3679 [Anaerocolumna sp.]|jgi:hypothetical protein|nr:hypothetical protein [Anaerocolumna sp.]
MNTDVLHYIGLAFLKFRILFKKTQRKILPYNHIGATTIHLSILKNAICLAVPNMKGATKPI